MTAAASIGLWQIDRLRWLITTDGGETQEISAQTVVATVDDLSNQIAAPKLDKISNPQNFDAS